MRLLIAAAAFGVLALAAPSSAQPVGYENQYKAALKLENDGDLVGALAAFEAIPPAQRDWATRLHIASCKRKLGRFLEAEKDYEAIANDASLAPATRETAATDLDDLRAKMPKVRVRLAPGTSGVTVLLDERTIEPPATVGVDPGAHVVRALRDGSAAFERKLQLSEGTTLEVVVDAPAPVEHGLPRQHGFQMLHPTMVASVPDVGAAHRNVAIVAFGVGVVALGVGTFFALRTTALVAERDDLAARGDMAANDRTSDARTSLAFARLGLGVGAVASAVGAVLLLTSPRATKTGEVRVTPTIAGTWGVSIATVF